MAWPQSGSMSWSVHYKCRGATGATLAFAIFDDFCKNVPAMPSQKISLKEALSRLPGSQGERYASMFTKGSFELEIYAPRGADPQQPHTRDELYFIVTGHGEFQSEGTTYAFEPNDVFFVPAGAEHRFTKFTDDLVVWAIFYGP